MLRIAISGHRGLTGTTAALVDKAIRAALAEHAPGVTGISCLADGADQIFARAVIDLGGQLEAIVPAAEYRDRLPEEAHREYDRLLAQATAVRRLPFAESTSESHMEASKVMIDDADELYAVWDGQPARAYGGTADVVAYAREHGTPVGVIWPHGAQRDLRQEHLFTRGGVAGFGSPDEPTPLARRAFMAWLDTAATQDALIEPVTAALVSAVHDTPTDHLRGQRFLNLVRLAEGWTIQSEILGDQERKKFRRELERRTQQADPHRPGMQQEDGPAGA